MTKKVLAGLVLALAVFLSVPLSAGAADYEVFVGCDDLSENPVPSHACRLGDFPGAYFESDIDTEYEVCVEFPEGSVICSEEEEAEAGILYVNSILSELEGIHVVTWFVEGVEVGFWAFQMERPAPPASPPSAPILSTPAAPAPTTSVQCLAARQRVAKLKNRLRKAVGRKQKAKLRTKLAGARAAARRTC